MSELAFARYQRRRNLVAAFGCTSAAAISMGLTWPLLALILHGYGFSNAVVGLSSASQSLAVFAAAPLAPGLIARIGLLRSILLSIAGVIAMLLLLPLTDNVYAWFPIRFLLGWSASTLFLGTETWVNIVAQEKTRGRTIGVFGLLWSAAFAIGPLLISLTGTEGWAPFIVGASIVLLSAMPLLVVGEAVPVVRGRAKTRVLRYVQLLPAASISALLLGAVDYILDAFLPLYALHKGMTQPASVTLLTVLLVGVTAAQFPAGWLADRFNRHHLLFGLTALSMISCVLLPFAVEKSWAAYLTVLVIGTGLGGIWTISVVMIGSRFLKVELPAAYAAGGVLHGIGMVVGPVVAGIASSVIDPGVIPLLIALCCLFYLPVTLIRPAR